MKDAIQRKKHSGVIVVVTTGCLFALVVVLAIANKGYVAQRMEAQSEGYFSVVAGEQSYQVTLEDIEALNPVVIGANYKASGFAAESRHYRGVCFKALTEYLSIDTSPYKQAVFSAADGYMSALGIDEALDRDNCFIVTGDGAGTALGTLESGGDGPFMMILPRAPFSQRWCKYLLEVKLQ